MCLAASQQHVPRITQPASSTVVFPPLNVVNSTNRGKGKHTGWLAITVLALRVSLAMTAHIRFAQKPRGPLPSPHPLQNSLTCPIVFTYSFHVWYRQNLWVFLAG